MPAKRPRRSMADLLAEQQEIEDPLAGDPRPGLAAVPEPPLEPAPEPAPAGLPVLSAAARAPAPASSAGDRPAPREGAPLPGRVRGCARQPADRVRGGG